MLLFHLASLRRWFASAVPKGNHLDVLIYNAIYYFVEAADNYAAVKNRKVSKKCFCRFKMRIVGKEGVGVPHFLHEFILDLLSESLTDVTGSLPKSFLRLFVPPDFHIASVISISSRANSSSSSRNMSSLSCHWPSAN